MNKQTVVIINHYCGNISASNFLDPQKFVPERWLGEKQYEEDQWGAVQPWLVHATVQDASKLYKSVQRTKLATQSSFALNNIKLAMVYVIVNFDIELGQGMEHWVRKRT